MPFDLWRNRQNNGACWATELKASAGSDNPGWATLSQEVTFTETTGAGVYTGTVTLPAGATLLDIIVHSVALWDTATSATLKVGDATDDDGYFTGVDLKATDLLAGEGLSISGGDESAGGKAGADVANNQINRRYSAAARAINGIVTTVGATGSAGRTRMTVVYSVPATPLAATKV